MRSSLNENIYRGSNPEPKFSSQKISVIIPVYREDLEIGKTLESIYRLEDDNIEIIIVYGGEDPELKEFKDSDIICIKSEKGRAIQLNEGALKSGGDILLFLHGDTELPYNAFKKIREVLIEEDYSSGAFSLEFDDKNLWLKFIARITSFRSMINKIPYGDQAIFVKREVFTELKGFKEIPILEDVDFMKRLKSQRYSIKILSDKVITSSEKYREKGLIWNTVNNRIIMTLYILGFSPEFLKRTYV